VSDDRPMRSEYMEWAKTRQKARYTLALSGILTASLSDLGAPLEDFVVSSPDAYGWRPLREAIASTAGTTTDRIVTTSGTSGANHVAMSALIRPGDEVVIEHPVYEPMAALARYLGAVLKPLPRRPENGFRIDPGDAARATGAGLWRFETTTSRVFSPIARAASPGSIRNPFSGRRGSGFRTAPR